MKRILLTVLILALMASPALGWKGAKTIGTVESSTTLPSKCGVGEVYIDTDAGSGTMYLCNPANTWVSTTAGVSGSTTISDDGWIGLGAADGRIEFDDQATDEVNILGANVGIGTSTLESWSATNTALQIGSSFSIMSLTAEASSSSTNISHNAYEDAGVWKYMDTGSNEAANYYMYNGLFGFRTAPAGTAGNNITWLNPLTITNAGLLQIGSAAGAGNVNITPQSAIDGLYIDQDYDDEGIYIQSDSLNRAAINMESKYGLASNQNISNGRAAWFYRDLDEAGAAALVQMINNHATNTQPTLFIDHDGTGGATGYGLHVDSENAAGPAVRIEGGTSGLVLDQSNDAVTPTFAFGDGDTGVFESVDDTLQIAHGGIAYFTSSATRLQSVTTGSFYMQRAAGSATDPIYNFVGDNDTGVGRAAADQLSLIAGGVEAMRFTEATGVLQTVESDVGLTADAGSAQGNGVITSSYNVYTTVGTAGDAATLPATAPVGTLVHIKNDAAANAMDVFPASGDDLGEGTNTALSLAAGKGAIFICTVADSTWTNILEGI